MLSTNDIKEELSLAYAHAVASRAGFSLEGIRKDRDSVDATVRSRGSLSSNATLISPAIDIQLKAHVFDPLPAGEFPFDVPVKNYRELIPRCAIPRILVVFIMPRDDKRWLSWTEDALVMRRSAYWLSLLGRASTTNKETERVLVPRSQVFEPSSLRTLLQRVGEEEEIL